MHLVKLYYSLKIKMKLKFQYIQPVSLIIYLLFSASLGKLIVNLQRDARNEFNGSTARRTPHACKVSLRKSAIPLRIAKLQIDSHKTIYIRWQKKVALQNRSSSWLLWATTFKKWTEFVWEGAPSNCDYLSKRLISFQYFQYNSLSLRPSKQKSQELRSQKW